MFTGLFPLGRFCVAPVISLGYKWLPLNTEHLKITWVLKARELLNAWNQKNENIFLKDVEFVNSGFLIFLLKNEEERKSICGNDYPPMSHFESINVISIIVKHLLEVLVFAQSIFLRTSKISYQANLILNLFAYLFKQLFQSAPESNQKRINRADRL